MALEFNPLPPDPEVPEETRKELERLWSVAMAKIIDDLHGTTRDVMGRADIIRQKLRKYLVDEGPFGWAHIGMCPDQVSLAAYAASEEHEAIVTEKFNVSFLWKIPGPEPGKVPESLENPIAARITDKEAMDRLEVQHVREAQEG